MKLAPAGGGRRATGTCWTTGSGLGFFAFFGFGLFFCAGLPEHTVKQALE